MLLHVAVASFCCHLIFYYVNTKFIHSIIDGHLGWFYFGALMNKSASIGHSWPYHNECKNAFFLEYI